MEFIKRILTLISSALQLICNIFELKKKQKSIDKCEGINNNNSNINNSFNQSYHYKIHNSTIKNEKNIIVNNNTSTEADTSSVIIYLFILLLIFIFCWFAVSPISLFVFILLLSMFYMCQNWIYFKKQAVKSTKIRVIIMFCIILLTLSLFQLNPFAPHLYNAEFLHDLFNPNPNEINESILRNNWYSLFYSVFRSLGITIFIASLFVSIHHYFFNRYLKKDYNSNSTPIISFACTSIIFSSGIFYKFLSLSNVLPN